MQADVVLEELGALHPDPLAARREKASPETWLGFLKPQSPLLVTYFQQGHTSFNKGTPLNSFQVMTLPDD